MEFMLLLARAHRIGVGSQWSLGASMPCSAMSDRFSVTPTMRVTVCGTRRRHCVNLGSTRPRSAISHSTACGLADAGRIAAARVALNGTDPMPRQPPSPAVRDALERLHPEPDSSVPAIAEAEFDVAADALGRAIDALPATR